MKGGFKTIYFVLCLIPWVILPCCFGSSGTPLEALLAIGRVLVILLVQLLSLLLTALGIFVATLAPRRSKAELLIMAGAVAIPGLWLLIDAPK
jgi:hypothetical protein